jgi:hypothetical protein
MDENDWEARVGDSDSRAPRTTKPRSTPVPDRTELAAASQQLKGADQQVAAETERRRTRQPVAPTPEATAATTTAPLAEPRRKTERPAAHALSRQGYQGSQPSLAQEKPVPPPTRRQLNTDGIPIPPKRKGVVESAREEALRRRRQRIEAERIARGEATDAEQAAATSTPVPASPSPYGGQNPGGEDLLVKTATYSVQPASMRHEATDEWIATQESRTWRAQAQQSPQAALPAARAYEAPGKAVSAPPEVASAPAVAGTNLHMETGPLDPRQARSSYPPASVSQRPVTATADLVAQYIADWREAQRAEMPGRCCATCRDFRSSDTPGRGWCVNPFAFAHRQMVSGDDLACLGALGTWWVESDQRWIEKLNMAPSAPTPLTDGLIHILSSRRTNARRS